MSRLCILAFASLCWLAAPGTIGAQTNPTGRDGRVPPGIAEGGEHGVDDTQYATFSAFRLMPASTSTEVNAYFYGYRWLSGSGKGTVMMDVSAGTDVPTGALLARICINVADWDPGGSIKLSLWEYEQPHDEGGHPFARQLDSSDSSGRSWDDGYTQLCVVPVHPFTAFGDIDADGEMGLVTYAIKVDFSTGGSLLQFGGVHLLWQLMSRPEPAVASFADVPPQHWAFRQIETLAASGIVAGCTAGAFCPDELVTRAEMAVLLAEALGRRAPRP